MFRKFAIAAVAVATMATAAVTITPNEAHAKNRHGGAIAAGAIIGLAASNPMSVVGVRFPTPRRL